MKRTRNFTIITVLVALIIILTACTPTLDKTQEPTDVQLNSVSLANPAAIYCEGLGYSMESVERNGGEDADCVFLDGSHCAQWDFLSGRCGQSFSYCEQQGGVLEAGGNIGICRFSDGSYCDEYAFFTNECAMGENPGEASATDVEEDSYPLETEIAFEDIEIQTFDDAFNYMLTYMKDEYGLETSDAWIEADITTDNTTATTTHRYVSGSVTVVISSMASAPATNYIINEVSDLTNGFFWQGSLNYDGTVLTDKVNPTGTILNVEAARDATLAYLAQAYGLPALTDWSDEGTAQGSNNDRPTTVRTFSDNSWIVEVEFEPAAPLVASYQVTVMDRSSSFKWEGEITLYGEINEDGYLP